MIIRSKEELFNQIVNNNKSFYDLTFSKEFNYDEARKFLPEIKKEGKEKIFKLIHDIFFNYNEGQLNTIKMYADEGDEDASYLYGFIKASGENTEQNIVEAIPYLEKALEKGVYCSAYILSLIYVLDEFSDEEKARKYAEMAIENGIYDGYFTLAQLANKENNEIFKILDKGASLDSKRCNQDLGTQAFYMLEFEDAEKYLTRAYELDDLDAGILLSRLYSNDDRPDEGGNIAIDITNRRENANAAWFALAEAYYFKYNASSEESKQGFEICKALIDNNYEEAYYLYGCMLLDGFGCEKDIDAGINSLRKAIEYFSQLENDYGNYYVEDSKKIIASAYKQNNLCQYCGGDFTGFLSKKCTKCGRKKDY